MLGLTAAKSSLLVEATDNENDQQCPLLSVEKEVDVLRQKGKLMKSLKGALHWSKTGSPINLNSVLYRL